MPTPARSAIARVVVLSYPLARNSSVAASLIRLSLSALLRSRRPFRGRWTDGDDEESILRVTALWRTRTQAAWYREAETDREPHLSIKRARGKTKLSSAPDPSVDTA